jgi:hypothetical protein
MFVLWFPWELRTCRLPEEVCLVTCREFVAKIYVVIRTAVFEVLVFIKDWLLKLLMNVECDAVTEVERFNEDVECCFEHPERLSPVVCVCFKHEWMNELNVTLANSELMTSLEMVPACFVLFSVRNHCCWSFWERKVKGMWSLMLLWHLDWSNLDFASHWSPAYHNVRDLT